MTNKVDITKTKKPNKSKLVEKKYLLTFILITSLFALWGFANDITNPMVAAFQSVMDLSAFKASMVQFAFYGGYATMAIPAALFIRRYSYKRGILLGLGLYAVGAFLFIPAAARQDFTFFCFSLYILTFGLAFLETTANPFILSLGSKETSTRRLNFAQAFNPVGSLTGMAVASFIVLPALVSDIRDDGGVTIMDTLDTDKAEIRVAESEATAPRDRSWHFIWNSHMTPPDARTESATVVPADNVRRFVTGADALGVNLPDLSATLARAEAHPQEATPVKISPAEMQRIRVHDLAVIRDPYVAIGLIVLCVFVIIALHHVPKTQHEGLEQHSAGTTLRNLWHNRLYRQGVLTQVCYVAAQIMVWTFIIQYADNLGISKATAQVFNIVAMSLNLGGRFVGTYVMKWFNSRSMLAFFGCGAIVMTLGTIFLVGMPGLICLVCISAFMSIMFPTIYGIALENVESQDTTLGAAFLVMAIVGGALMPPLQGLIIDAHVIAGMPAVNISFVLPLLCFIVVMYYGLCARRAQRRATVAQ